MSQSHFSTLTQLTQTQNEKNVNVPKVSIYDFDISSKPYPSKYRNYDTLDSAYGKPEKRLEQQQGCRYN